MSAFDETALLPNELRYMESLGLTAPRGPLLPQTYGLGVIEHWANGKLRWSCSIDLLYVPCVTFFRFYIARADGTGEVWNSGSGTLSDFWPSIVLLANNDLLKEPANVTRTHA